MKANITINERVKDLRTERGLTQKQLADAVGIAYSTYGDYEQDDYFIPHTAVITMAKYFRQLSQNISGNLGHCVRRLRTLCPMHSDTMSGAFGHNVRRVYCCGTIDLY